MTSVLHWCLIGVRKSQPAPIATGIRNGSGLSARLAALPAAIGAITRTVAALLRKGVIATAATSTSPSAPSGDRGCAGADSHPATSPVAPVVSGNSLNPLRQKCRRAGEGQTSNGFDRDVGSATPHSSLG